MFIGDLKDPNFCKEVVKKTIDTYGKLDILVNNAGTHDKADDIRDISYQQFDSTFKTNVYSMFCLTQEALNHMKEGSSIINTTSVVAYKGNPMIVDYASTKGAMEAFTFSLASNLMEKGIRVNAVAPGPIWYAKFS